jgi:transposase
VTIGRCIRRLIHERRRGRSSGWSCASNPERWRSGWGAEPGTEHSCSECSAVSAIQNRVERRWRDLDTCQFRTLLCARVPRVRTTRVPRAEPASSFTMRFDRLAIAGLPEATPMAVPRRLGLSWDEARGIMARAVRHGAAAAHRGETPR